MNRIETHLGAGLSILLLMGFWELGASVADSPVLPSPQHVASVLVASIRSGELPYHLGATLVRLILSFVISMAAGTLIGIALGRHPNLDRIIDAWLVVLLSVPALVTIILCYVWLGLTELAAISAVVLNKVPNVIVTVREGTRALDQELLEMARVYHFGRIKTLRHVVWPQLFPFLMVAARTGLALIWKVILIVELLGRSNGMGYQLHLFFQMFDVPSILAYTLSFVIVMQSFELVALKPLERRAERWRR
jgi:NitT/TauT family transport system permease protein